MPPELILDISKYGYFAIFVLIFLQETGVPDPIPNELVLLFSGYLTFTGILYLPWVILTAALADFIGTNILYIVFYFSGAYILQHKPRWLPVSQTAIHKLTTRISNGNKWMIYIGRLTPFIRGYTSVACGLIRLKPRIFLPIALISAITWSAVYVIAGRLLGPYWNYVAGHFSHIRLFLLIILLSILIFIIIRYIIHKSPGKKNISSARSYTINEHRKLKKIKIHIVSETPYINKGQGVHTAFMDHIKLMKQKDDVEVVVNGEGTGDVFHSHTYGPYYFWKGRKYKGKRVFTAHVIPDSVKGSFPMWHLWVPFVKWYLRKVYSYADVCIAISPRVEEAIHELGAHTKIEKIYNPVLIDQWKRTEEMRKTGREKLGIAAGDFLVLGVGQLEGRKGVDDFLEIAEAMPELKFVWVGGRPFGIMTEGIRRLNGKIAKASDHIKFTGLLDLSEMPDMYAAGDLFLFPSYQENCPLAPLEAAASGMPVIFRDLKEYSTLYENPYLKAKNIHEFIALISRMREDKDFYKEGKEISEKLMKQFDKNTIRKELIRLYERLAEN